MLGKSGVRAMLEAELEWRRPVEKFPPSAFLPEDKINDWTERKTSANCSYSRRSLLISGVDCVGGRDGG